jgi:hypothetical protein
VISQFMVADLSLYKDRTVSVLEGNVIEFERGWNITAFDKFSFKDVPPESL